MLPKCDESLLVRFSGRVPFVSKQRHLRVHHKLSLLGKIYHHVWLGTGTILTNPVILHVVLVPLSQTRSFQYPLENELAPVSLCFSRPLQRERQILRILTE
ncbi:putative alpha helix chain domain protein [Burkholderia pseudomallei MSHR543]|nr:putative alpha helix chain domain protein [Burkholderia pseudomallei MSHR543]